MGKPRNRDGIESFEELSMCIAILTYMGWGIVMLVGYVKEFLQSFLPSQHPEKNREVRNIKVLQVKNCCDNCSFL